MYTDGQTDMRKLIVACRNKKNLMAVNVKYLITPNTTTKKFEARLKLYLYSTQCAY